MLFCEKCGLAGFVMDQRHHGHLPAMPSSATSRPALPQGVAHTHAPIEEGLMIADCRLLIFELTNRPFLPLPIKNPKSTILNRQSLPLLPVARRRRGRTRMERERNRPSRAQRKSRAPLVHDPFSCGLSETALPPTAVPNISSAPPNTSSTIPNIPSAVPNISSAVPKTHAAVPISFAPGTKSLAAVANISSAPRISLLRSGFSLPRLLISPQ